MQAWKRDYNPEGGEGGGGGGGGLFGPVGDLFRSVFYMTFTAGFCLGVGCIMSPEVRAGVKQGIKDIKRHLKGKKKKKRRSKTSSSHGRGAPVTR